MQWEQAAQSEEGAFNVEPGVIVPLKLGSSCLGDGCLVQIREGRVQQKYPGHQGINCLIASR